MQPRKLLIVGAVLLASCSRTTCPPCPTAGIVAVPETQVSPVHVVWVDTIRVPAPYPVVDSIVFRKNDSLHDALLVSNYRLARIKEYLRIINRNPSQVKFIRGWLNRVFLE
ncbi:MAG: hypothetical protein EOP52_13215 [Sphingobacteriales bacterium]|nr:MAG: hypothetical protein EOP52_13215 [Sphingobacteriales bacterium]